MSVQNELLDIMVLRCRLNYLRSKLVFEVAPSASQIGTVRGGGISDPTFKTALAVEKLIERLVLTEKQYREKCKAADLKLMVLSNPETREMLRMHYFEAMPWKEVSETLHIPSSTLYRKRKHAIKILNNYANIDNI